MKMTKLRFFSLTAVMLSCCFFWFKGAQSESENLLRNGSFEDIANHSTVPEEWLDFGPESESPPDIHPTGTFMVTKAAKHGDTYIGMVVRDNETWEKIGQKLDQPLKKGKKYQLRGYIARSETFVSVSKLTNERANYTQSIILRINGAEAWEDNLQQLGQTPPILNYDWKYFELTLKPKSNAAYFVVEAYYNDMIDGAYNGNILLDDLELVEL
ncbi:MAG: hypothetical protein Sapg2KO_06910 [Saprospiraceae bacterium]